MPALWIASRSLSAAGPSGDVDEMYYVGTDGVMVTNEWIYYEFDDGTAYSFYFDGEGKLDNAEYA